MLVADIPHRSIKENVVDEGSVDVDIYENDKHDEEDDAGLTQMTSPTSTFLDEVALTLAVPST